MAPKDTKVFPNSPAHPSMMKTRNKTLSVRLALLTLLAVGSLAGCSKSKSPDVSDSIRKSLDQANLKSVSGKPGSRQGRSDPDWKRRNGQ